MAKVKPEGYRPKKLTDEEIWNSVYQIVLKAALHNKNVSVEDINKTTNDLVKTIKSITD